MPESNGPAWRQTTFFPFSLTAHYAKGGTVLTPKLASDQYETESYGNVDTVDSVAVKCADDSLAIFAVNRSMEDPTEFSIRLPDGLAPQEISAESLHDEDIYAQNTLKNQTRVAMKKNSSVRLKDSSMVSVTLPAVSWTVIHVE
jgi:alpha-N-arabinofuranosidase